MKIALATRSLTRGGAQVQVVQLACGLSRRGHDVHVVVLYAGGVLQELLEQQGVGIICLGKRGRWDNLSVLLRYARAARGRFDVVYSFLPVGNLMSLAVTTGSRTRLIWGLRGASQDTGQHGFASRLLWWLQELFLSVPDAVISNSHAALRELDVKAESRFRVIPNGIDIQRFRQDAIARKEVRSELAVGDHELLVGCVARLDTVKDHGSVLAAASLIIRKRSDAKFVMVGGGDPCYRQLLDQVARRSGIASSVLWLDDRADVERVLNSLDIYISASTAEGFSNSLAEAMACGVAPVVTDVGDCALIVSRFGSVVPMKNPARLADEVLLWASKDSPSLRADRSNWIRDSFGLDKMLESTERVLATVANVSV